MTEFQGAHARARRKARCPGKSRKEGQEDFYRTFKGLSKSFKKTLKGLLRAFNKTVNGLSKPSNRPFKAL